VNEHDGIAYTKKAMQQYRSDALQILDEIAGKSNTSQLKALVDYVIDRKI
jgi:geranylgeranyl pyrophosphate synthase